MPFANHHPPTHTLHPLPSHNLDIVTAHPHKGSIRSLCGAYEATSCSWLFFRLQPCLCKPERSFSISIALLSPCLVVLIGGAQRQMWCGYYKTLRLQFC